MVTGKEKVFDNIYEARDYILRLEQRALSADNLRSEVPSFMRKLPENLDHPKVAHFNSADEDKFIMKQLRSGRYSLSPNLKSRKFLFRGEAEFHDPCKPSLYRDAKKTYFLDQLIYGHEMFRLILSHPLVQLLDMGINLNGHHIQFEMNLYGLTQHYYNKTTLLDLTSDIDVALFFATQSYDWKTDSYSPLVDETHEPGILYYYDLNCCTDFVFGRGLSTIGLQVFPRSGRQKGFLYDCERDFNFKTHPQVHAVRFKHNAEIAREISDIMREEGRQLFPHDILEDHWSQRHPVKMQEKRVSYDAVLINMILNEEETFDSLRMKLENDYGIEVADYKPVLTEDELHQYYEDVRSDNLWEKFCDQIYIPGDMDGKMMADLRNVPNHPQYEWAFKEDVPSQLDYDRGYLLKYYKKALERE